MDEIAIECEFTQKKQKIDPLFELEKWKVREEKQKSV